MMRRKTNYRKRRKSKVEPLSPMGFRVKKKLSKKQKAIFILGFPIWVILGCLVVFKKLLSLLIKNWRITLIALIVGIIFGSLVYLNISIRNQQNTLEYFIEKYEEQNKNTIESIEELKQNYLIQYNQLKEKETKVEELEKTNKELEEKNKQLSQRKVTLASRSTQVTSRGGTVRTTVKPVVQPKSSLQSYAKSYMSSTYGWGDDQFASLVNLWNRESGWNPNAHNSSSGAHGIPQALPASKMASCGSDYYTNGETQIRWGLQYIKGRYGNPNKAWAFFQSHNWY